MLLHFQVNFYYVIYDTCIQQVSTRFKDFLSIGHKLCLHLKYLSQDDANKTHRFLALIYKNDVDVEQSLAEYHVYKSLYHDSLEGINEWFRIIFWMLLLLAFSNITTPSEN